MILINNNPPTPGSVTFDTAGTHTWTVPANVYRVLVEMWGGGGGGGGAPNSNHGGGGGGSAYVLGLAATVPGSTMTVTVGAGGTTATNQPGGKGGNSSFAGLTVNGGFGGGVATSGSDGSSGGAGAASAVTGDILLSYRGSTGPGKYGGAAAGSGGILAGSSYTPIDPIGQFGAGGRGGVVVDETFLPDGVAPGGGGHGGSNLGGAATNYRGGVGAPGKIIIRW